MDFMSKESKNSGKTESRPTEKPALMNSIWFFLIVCSILSAVFCGNMSSVTDASFEAAKDAVNLALGLVGAMALWLGLVRIAEAGGLMNLLAKWIRPVMKRLFPDIPPEDPAMSAMILNMAANALGLGNAATPLGIKAMMALNRLNPGKGQATDAMCLFLAINTSNVTLLPLGVISVRAAAGASDPAAILVPTILSTTCSTIVAIIAAKCLRRISSPITEEEMPESDQDRFETTVDSDNQESDSSGKHAWKKALAGIIALFFLFGMLWHCSRGEIEMNQFSNWLVPGLILCLVCFGFSRGISVYETAVEGAKEGFQVAVRLIPFLVMILVAVGMFRASGAFEILAKLLAPLTDLLQIPVEILPVALLRPLSGSGAFGLMSEITCNDPNGFAAFLAGTIQGSTETTFYVLAIYFGAVGVYKTRYAVTAALLADLAGFLAAVAICHWLYPA